MLEMKIIYSIVEKYLWVGTQNAKVLVAFAMVGASN